MKLIDKDAVVAKIDKFMYGANLEADIASTGECFNEEVANAKYKLCKQIKDEIDTLEVKEVDLEKEIYDFMAKEWDGIEEDKHFYDMIKNDLSGIAKHFFELGLKASQPTTYVYGIEEALKENGIDPDSKEADMYREAIYKIYDRLKAQKGE